jgi:homoserine kinase
VFTDWKQPQIASVRVPGSTSNFGSGFDCIGMAVDLWLTVTCNIQYGNEPTRFKRTGTVSHLKMEPFQDMISTGFTIACMRQLKEMPPYCEFTVHSDIPVARGLGSSTAAMVAGAALGDLFFDLKMGSEGVAQMVSQIEEHPDNAVPAVYGGCMLGVAKDNAQHHRPCTYHLAKLPIHPRYRFVFAIPPFEIKTSEARERLPEEIEYSRAVTAVQRSAALVHGLTFGDVNSMERALTDVLHVPYRRTMIPGYDKIIKTARDAGAHGATLSGSGSTIMAVCDEDWVEDVSEGLTDAFALQGMEVGLHVSDGNVRGMEVLKDPFNRGSKLYQPFFSYI